MSKPTIKQYVLKKATAKRVPVSGTFELTSRCNFNCRMCYIRMTDEEQMRYGSELTTEEWLSVGRQAVKAGMVYLLLTGGEPMIRPDFTKIYTEMIQMGVMISVNTNASCITPEIIDCFKKHPPEAVNVTLYGSSEDTYRNLCGNSAGYSKALRGVCLLQEARIRVNLNTTFTKLNLHSMDGLIAFAKDRKLHIRTAAYVFPKVRNGMEEQTVSLSPEEHGEAAARFDSMTLTEEQLLAKRIRILKCLNADLPADMIPQSKNPSCMAGRGSFWVCWDGRIYPCGMLPDNRFNVKETDFSVCWDAISERIPHLLLPSECSVCRYSALCPICAALTQSLNGDTSVVPREMCRYIEAYSHAFLEFTDGLEGGVKTVYNDSEDYDNCVL